MNRSKFLWLSVFFLIVFMVVVFSLTGCVQTETAKEGETIAKEGDTVTEGGGKIKIGLSMYAQDVPYWVVMVDSAKKYAEEKGFELIITNANLKMDKQVSDIEDLIAAGVQAIVFTPVDYVGGIESATVASEAGIPIIAFDDPIDPAAPVVTNSVADYYEVARKAGRYAGELIGNKDINVVNMNGLPGVGATYLRQMGALVGLADHQLENYNSTTFKVISQGWGNWGYEDAHTAMEDILSSTLDTKIDVIFSGNDTMALACLDSMEEAGRLDELILLASTADGQKEAFEAMINGDYDGKYVCTGLIWPSVSVRNAIDIALECIKGNTDWPPKMLSDAPLVTKENVKDYYDPNAGF